MKKLIVLVKLNLLLICMAWGQTTVLSEDFSGLIVVNGDISIAGSLDSYMQTPGWTGSKIYMDGGRAKLGTSGDIGILTTPKINLSANSGKALLSFNLLQFGSDSGKLIQVLHAANGSTFTQVGSKIPIPTTASTITVPISGGTANSKIRIQAEYASNNRFYLDDFALTQAPAAVYKEEPSNHVTNFMVATGSPAYSVIEVVWDDALGTVVPDGYLVKGTALGYSFIATPVDGTAETAGALLKNVSADLKLATFTELAENTTYYFKIYPYTNSGVNINYKTDGTVPSAAIVTGSGPPAAPMATAASAVAHEGFTARWATVAGATSYRLDVLEGLMANLNEGFEGATTANPPSNWTRSSTGSYILNNQNNAHSGSSYAALSGLGGWVQTPLISNPTACSFWARSFPATASFTVKVQTSPNGTDWTDQANYSATPTDAGTLISTYTEKTIALNLNGDYYIRWYIDALVSGAINFDDVLIRSGGSSFVSGWNDVPVYNALIRVSGLASCTYYTYRVRAVNAVGTSAMSNSIEVCTAASVAGTGASTAIGGASTIVNIPVVSPLTDNSIEIDPDSETSDDLAVIVYVTETSITYNITSSDAVLNGLYMLKHANLGFIPAKLIVNSGTVVDWHGDESATLAQISGFTAKGTLIITLEEVDNTLPVELSSFTVALIAHSNAVLTWVTQSETNVSGFYIYRNTESVLATALMISELITATNTSQQKVYIYCDKDLQSASIYYYWLQVVDLDGSDSFHGPISLVYEGSNDFHSPGVPKVTKLKSLYPNPFNPSSTISYSLAFATAVQLQIFDARGRLVFSPAAAQQNAGHHQFVWQAEDLASGVYFIRMQIGEQSFTQKAVLLK